MLKIILDTNCALDAFLFDDPIIAPLLEKVTVTDGQIITSESCFSEWLMVLRYEKLKLSEAQITEAEQRFCARVTIVKDPEPEAAISYPQCRDRDDQKFIDAAISYQCAFLISRDKQVLKLAKKMAHYNVVVRTPLMALGNP